MGKLGGKPVIQIQAPVLHSFTELITALNSTAAKSNTNLKWEVVSTSSNFAQHFLSSGKIGRCIIEGSSSDILKTYIHTLERFYTVCQYKTKTQPFAIKRT